MQSGKWLIVGILTIGVLAAATAWWHQRQQGQRALALWGSHDAYRIRHAAAVELVRLVPVTADSDHGELWLEGDGQARLTGELRDISHSPGILHARQALIVDASFDWSPDLPDTNPNWEYAVRFVDDSGQVTLLFDLDLRVARRLGDSRAVKLTIARGLRTFFEEKLDDSSSGT